MATHILPLSQNVSYVHFKNMCAKFNLKMLFPLNCWHNMSLPWQHISPHSYKSFLHIYTSRPTCIKPNFFCIACKMFCFPVFWIIHCYHGNAHPATVPKCVMHSYTSTWTCTCQIWFEMHFPLNFWHNMPLPWQHTFLHCQKVCFAQYTIRPPCVPNFTLNA